MLANLRDAEDLSHMQPPSTPQSRPNVARFNEHEGNRTDEGARAKIPVVCQSSVNSLLDWLKFLSSLTVSTVIVYLFIYLFFSLVEALTFPPTSGKSFIMGTDEAMESELGLGELAGLTVANEADSLAYDVSRTRQRGF